MRPVEKGILLSLYYCKGHFSKCSDIYVNILFRIYLFLFSFIGFTTGSATQDPVGLEVSTKSFTNIFHSYFLDKILSVETPRITSQKNNGSENGFFFVFRDVVRIFQ